MIFVKIAICEGAQDGVPVEATNPNLPVSITTSVGRSKETTAAEAATASLILKEIGEMSMAIERFADVVKGQSSSILTPKGAGHIVKP